MYLMKKIEQTKLVETIKKNRETQRKKSTFSLDKSLETTFRKECKKLGITASSAVEELMKQFLGV